MYKWHIMLIYTLFHKQQFYNQHQAKNGKKIKNNAKQHPEAELLLSENYSHSSLMLSSKYNWKYSKKISERKSVSVFMRLYD